MLYALTLLFNYSKAWRLWLTLLINGPCQSLNLLWIRPEVLKLSGVKFGLWVWWPLIRTKRPSMVVWTLQRQLLESLSRHAQFSLSRYWLFTQNLLFWNMRTIFPALDGKKKASVKVRTTLLRNQSIFFHPNSSFYFVWKPTNLNKYYRNKRPIKIKVTWSICCYIWVSVIDTN